MTKWNQLRSALGRGDSGDARDFQGISLGILSRRTLATVALFMRIKACACAVRDVAGLAVTSTMRTRPFSS